MSDYNPRALSELIDPGWAAALAPVEDRVHELGAMLAAEVDEGRGYLPAGTDVLRAFTYPFEQVKVLIVGQDPYPTPGHAMGLSFSVRPGVQIPRSLVNIFRELCEDIGCQPPSSGDLTAWSEQGVCLLNRVLTVRPGAPASHRGRGWEEVTQCAIDALVARRRPDGSPAPLVAILWGKDAQSLMPRLGETPVIASPHPSPLSARRGFFGSRPFSRANRMLEEQGASGVDWSRGSADTSLSRRIHQNGQGTAWVTTGCMSAELDVVGWTGCGIRKMGTAVSSRRSHELPASSCSGDAVWSQVVRCRRMLGPRLARRSWQGWRACPRGVSPA